MPTSLQLAAGDPAMLAAVQRARKMLNRRALMGAEAGETVAFQGREDAIAILAATADAEVMA